MSTSRRTFLKSTVAGFALGDLRALAMGTAPEPLPGARTSPRLGAESAAAGEYTRGVGVYPGDPREDFGPVLLTDASTYRNLALRRPAYHSSCYDYNLTAQLVTDGIKDTHLPNWVTTSVSYRGLLPKIERE